MNEKQHHLDIVEDVHSAPASELERFVAHPENGLRLGDADFYASEIDRINNRRAVVRGSIPVGTEGSLDVNAIVVMPTKAGKAASRILGREPYGNVHLTYTRGPNRH